MALDGESQSSSEDASNVPEIALKEMHMETFGLWAQAASRRHGAREEAASERLWFVEVKTFCGSGRDESHRGFKRLARAQRTYSIYGL